MLPATSADITRLRRLMNGTSIDKDLAERTLMNLDPASLPDDFLDCWSGGATFDKFRAGRVKESWRKLAMTELNADLRLSGGE